MVDAGILRQPVGRADGNDDVVARSVADVAEDALEDAGALVEEEHLVGVAVAVEEARGHGVGRADDAHHHVVVEEQRVATLRRHDPAPAVGRS